MNPRGTALPIRPDQVLIWFLREDIPAEIYVQLENGKLAGLEVFNRLYQDEFDYLMYNWFDGKNNKNSFPCS